MKKPTSGDGQRLFDYMEKRFNDLEKKLEETKKEAPKPQAARTKSTTK